MKVKTLIFIVLLIFTGAAAAYAGTTEVLPADYWILGIFGVSLLLWLWAWFKKELPTSGKFIKFINTKAF